MDWFIAKFFFIAFFKGFLVGCIIRFIIAIIFKFDMSFGGLIRSGIVAGLLYTLLTYYMILQY